MNTLDYIVKKFDLDLNQKPPIQIPSMFREVMAQTMHELGFRVGAEIGVWKGEHARLICENMPNVTLYCVDPWVRNKGYLDYHTRDFEPAYKTAIEQLRDYHCTFIRRFSMDAVRDFENESLDFVYIDANHDIRHVIDDIDEWSKKVRKGGIISGHDYMRSRKRWRTNQVYDAVNAYTYANRINPWFALGQNLKVTERGNGVQSWMWVKK